MGGFFEPKFEIGTGDEMYIDVTTDLGGGGGRGSVEKLIEARMGQAFVCRGKPWLLLEPF